MASPLGSQFRCNICGESSIFSPDGDWREAASCSKCGSSVRSRQIAYCVSSSVLNKSQCLKDVYRPDLIGLGLSDSGPLASALAQSFSYTNTFYHTEPRLDICRPAENRAGTADFLVSSDVFEHVPAPVCKAFTGAYSVLKPGGTLVLTVPFDNRSETTEHFPNVREFSVTSIGSEWILVGKTEAGEIEAHRNPVFHGGPGTTAEMRFFSREALIKDLADAGFKSIEVHAEVVEDYGIFPPHDEGLPITAKKPF